SSTLSILSVVGFLTLGINYGIDFRGGSLIEVQSKQGDANLGDIRSRLSDLNIGEIQVQQFGAPNDVLIRVGTQDAGENAEQTVIDKVRGELQDQYDFRRVEVVGPTVSGELAKQGT
ncbi:MAG: protein translocase subunit SecDF, partial [Mesorhizobium sp.]